MVFSLSTGATLLTASNSFAIINLPLRDLWESEKFGPAHPPGRSCGSGGIGRHTILRGWRREACGFKSRLPHHTFHIGSFVKSEQAIRFTVPERICAPTAK